MADLPEDDGYPEGIIKLETTMRGKGGDVVYNQDGEVVDGFLNAPLQQLASRTAWLKENMGASGGSAISTEGIYQAEASFATAVVGGMVPGSTHILDARTVIVVHSDSDVESILQQEFVPFDLKSVPIGSEFHFICKGEPQDILLVRHTVDTKIVTVAGSVDINQTQDWSNMV